MPPKRCDRYDGSAIEVISSDLEIFLQAYEKPTQIYRYLRTRNMCAPVYLYRNLTYMPHRLTRRKKPSGTFKVNSMLERIENSIPARLGDYMTLMFLGVFDRSIVDIDAVEVETYLSTATLKKRKDIKPQLDRVGISKVKINPDDAATCSRKIPAVSVSTDSFKPINGSQNTSYDLVLHVRVASSVMAITCINTDEEPSSKRLKTNANIHYECDLAVFDKQCRCLLYDGEYELPLRERYTSKAKAFSPKKQPSWEREEVVTLDKLSYDTYQKTPVLKFRIAWTKERCAEFVDRPLPITIMKQHDQIMTPQSMLVTDQNHNGTPGVGHDDEITKLAVENADKGGVSGVDYCFIYNNNTRQQTQACDFFTCPWCKLNCIELYALLKHLKLCHARFNFTFVPSSGGRRNRIDVCINEQYDGSYTGSPHDMGKQSGCAFSRAGPVRRTVVTRILVCRPRRNKKPSLSEFLEREDENELNSQRPYITGHNRLYYHATTWLPAQAKELDVDSEDETGPPWLQQKTQMMIDDFTDVNEGEKEIMKMWNIHTMRNGYVGDIQIPLACDMFVDQMGLELLRKNLYKNFVLHMSHLVDNDLISTETHMKVMVKLHRVLATDTEAQEIIQREHQQQDEHWDTVGRAKHKKQLLSQKTVVDSKLSVKDAGHSSGIKTKEDKSTKKDSGNKPSRILPKRKEAGSCATKTAAITTPIAGPSNTRRQHTLLHPIPREPPIEIESKRRSLPLRNDPPKRRNSGSTTIQPATTAATTSALTNSAKKFPPNRRNSIAAESTLTNRKRMLLSLTKLDK